MIEASGDLAHPCHAGNLHRSAAACRRAIAKLAARVRTPRPDRAVSLESERMKTSGSNRRHPGQSANKRRHVAVGDGSIAELTDIVTPPRPHSAVGAEREAVLVATGDGDNARQRGEDD